MNQIRTQRQAHELAKQLERETGIFHSYCDGCHEVEKSKDLIQLGDEHNTLLVLGECCAAAYHKCCKCKQAVEYVHDNGKCNECYEMQLDGLDDFLNWD